MNIACYLITKEGTLKAALLPKELLLDLTKELRGEGPTPVHLVKETIEAQGLFIPAKGTAHTIMVLPNIEEDKHE